MSEGINDDNCISFIAKSVARQVARKGIPGHDEKAVSRWFHNSSRVIRSGVEYDTAREFGMDPKDAVERAAEKMLKRYRSAHNI